VPKLEFLANMNISPLTVGDLRTLGWNIVRVPEIMDSKSKDIDILTYAREHNKVVVTQDLDFSSLLALRGYEKPSVINLRFENAKPGFITNRIIEIVSELEKELNEGIVVSVDEISARYRNLPIETK
jgi:predicted nuclease of predicted toxin-antitoxin system